MKKFNFSAGPSILPREVIEETAKAVLDLNGIGLSLLEISHRSKDFQAVLDEAVALFKELLDIPQGYVLEDKPESGKITLSDNGASLLYSISQMENKVVLKYVFDISKMIYLPSDYPELKWFWDNVAEKNNAMLVLKKH